MTPSLKDARLEVNINEASEKFLSTGTDVAIIDKISLAIFAIRGY